MIAIDQRNRPLCTTAAWVNALLAVEPAVSFPDGRTPSEWTVHADSLQRCHRSSRVPGRSITAAARVHHAAGLIDTYTRLDELHPVLDALDDGPVVASLRWTTGLDHPDPMTAIATAAGRPTRGHAVALLERITCQHSTNHPSGDFVRFRNSHGATYGRHGDALITVADLARTLNHAYSFTRTLLAGPDWEAIVAATAE